MSNDKGKTFWHYTDKKSAEAILKTGKLRPSQQSQGDAVFGDGVYATTMHPMSKTVKSLQCVA